MSTIRNTIMAILTTVLLATLCSWAQEPRISSRGQGGANSNVHKAFIGGNFTFLCFTFEDLRSVEFTANGSLLSSEEGIRIGIFGLNRAALVIDNVSMSWNETNVTCKATYPSGRVEASAVHTLYVQGVLSPVGSLTVSRENSTILLSWIAPFTVINEVTYYIAVDFCGSTRTYVQNGTEFTFDLDDHHWCDTYQFEVTPQNLVGSGYSVIVNYSLPENEIITTDDVAVMTDGSGTSMGFQGNPEKPSPTDDATKSNTAINWIIPLAIILALLALLAVIPVVVACAKKERKLTEQQYLLNNNNVMTTVSCSPVSQPQSPQPELQELHDQDEFVSHFSAHLQNPVSQVSDGSVNGDYNKKSLIVQGICSPLDQRFTDLSILKKRYKSTQHQRSFSVGGSSRQGEEDPSSVVQPFPGTGASVFVPGENLAASLPNMDINRPLSPIEGSLPSVGVVLTLPPRAGLLPNVDATLPPKAVSLPNVEATLPPRAGFLNALPPPRASSCSDVGVMETSSVAIYLQY